MVPITRTIQALLVSALFAANACPADEKTRPPLKDAFGDELPDGAIVRMGSTRFRHAGLTEFVILPDGKSIATIGYDGLVRFWNSETGKRTRMVSLEKASGRLFTLSADGKLAAGCTQEALTVWETVSGKLLTTLAGPKSYPSQLCFSPDGKMIGVGGGNCQFTVWNWKAGKENPIPIDLPQMHPGADSTIHCHFSPDSKYFVAGPSASIPLRVFETKTWAEVQRFACEAKTSVFSPDNRSLIVCSSNGGRNASIRVFDVVTGKELNSFALAHERGYYSLAVSPDGRVLGCGASDKSCLLDLTTGKVLHKLTDWTWGLSFSPDAKTFVASANAHVRLWDVGTGKERHEQPASFGSTLATAVSPGGRLVAVADWSDRAVQMWDTATGKRVGQCALKDESRHTRDLTFSTDGRTISAGLYQGFIQTWEVATGKELQAIQLGDGRGPGNQREVYYFSTRVAANRPQIATLERVYDGTNNTRLTIWDGETRRPIRDKLFPGERRHAAWSLDGDTLALALDNGVYLIELESCNERAHLLGSTASVPVMSRDGRLVAVRRTDDKPNAPSVGVYEVATGKAVANVPTGAVAEIALAADNRTLIGSDHARLQTWDLATGKEISRKALPDPGTDGWGRTPVTRMEPLRNGQIFTSHTDGTALVWDLSPVTSSAPFAKADEKQFAAWWADLLSDDSARAYTAVWRMSESSPDEVVAFLRPHLQVETPPDAAKLRLLIADLNSDTFRVREKAAKDLQELGHRAVPALRKALEAKPPAEAVRRIEQLLSRKPDVGNRPEQLRRLRAMQVLERIGSKEARELFAQLADGLPLAADTREAKAALGRLGEPRWQSLKK